MTGPSTPRRQRWCRVLAHFFRGCRGAYAMLIATSILGGILEAASLAMLLPFLESLIGVESAAGWLAGPGRSAVDWFAARFPGADALLLSCAVLMVIYLLRQAVMLTGDIVIASTSARVMHDARRSIYHKYAAAPYGYFLQHKVGELTYNSTIPSKSLAVALITGPRFVVELCRVIGILLLLAWVNPLLTLILAVAATVLYVPLTHLMGRRVYRSGVETRNLNTRLSAELSEFYTGIKQILVKNALPDWLARIDGVNAAFRRAYRRETLMPSLPAHAFETVAVLGMLMVVILLRILSPDQLRGSLPLVGLFGMGLLRTLPSFMMLGKHWMIFSTCMPDVERMYLLLKEGVPATANGTQPVAELKQGIAFDRVTFAYGSGSPLFSDLSLEFPRGRFCVVTGLSGAGKTTLMNLILGLYTPTAGRVLIDGTDLRQLDRRAWYARIGFVSQDIFLFHGTIEENIRMFQSGFTRADMEEAAKLAHAHEFIMRLPQGYETVVGERGLRLSGGQQQRLALARALVHKPEVILMDEATAALDAESERIVCRAVAEVARGRTVIAIAHRKATIQQARHIFIIEEGRLAAQGSHEALMAGSLHYRVLQE